MTKLRTTQRIRGNALLSLWVCGVVSPVFASTLPKSPSYLRLVNLEFRGKALDVVISRLPSGRVVRHVSFKAAEQS
ncbi:MAG TPA: hypothetical protein VNX69_15980 [Steroidobacteraceae bacterium]|jgi:hypothetical protein|nr:hypothetical protein [Steroidobacteraceae bacterium]